MFILFTNLFLARPFRLENTLECYNLRGGQGGSTEVWKMLEMILEIIYMILILINFLWVEIVLVWLTLELHYYNLLMKMQFLKYIALNVITQVENMLINLDISLI
jgi:hypothetical protein